MSLKSSFTSLRNKLFNKFNEITESSALIQDQATSTFDPATGTTTQAYAVSITDTVYLRNYNQSELQGEVLAGDVLVKLKCENVATEIKPNALVTIGSDVYNVVSNDPVPKTNFVIQNLHCRGVNDA